MKTHELIKKYRTMQNLTQAKLAEKSGMLETTLRKYELGERHIRPEQIEKIAKGLNINSNFLKEINITTASDIASLIDMISSHKDIEIQTKNNTIELKIHNQEIANFLNYR